MLMDMIKKPKTIDDVLEKLDELATRVEVDAKLSNLPTRDEMDAKIDATAGDLAIMIEEGFAVVAKQDDLLMLTERVVGLEKDMKGMHDNFAVVFGDLKNIRNRLDRIEKSDTSIDVINLDLRVRKLEKRAKL